MASAAKTALSAYLGRGTKFKGELRFSGILRIDGILEGQILSEGTLSIEPQIQHSRHHRKVCERLQDRGLPRLVEVVHKTP